MIIFKLYFKEYSWLDLYDMGKLWFCRVVFVFDLNVILLKDVMKGVLWGRMDLNLFENLLNLCEYVK